MLDVAFVALTIVVFGVMALVVRGVERLAGQRQGGEEIVPSGGRYGTGYGTERLRADSGGPSGTAGSTGAVGAGAHLGGQVAR